MLLKNRRRGDILKHFGLLFEHRICLWTDMVYCLWISWLVLIGTSHEEGKIKIFSH